MKLHYSLPAKIVLDPERGPAALDLIHRAGVGKVWLYGYFFGHMEASIEKLVEAHAVLERHGFEVGIISVPVGHPGNSIDPDDTTLDVRIPAHWRYRVDRHGQVVYHCGDIDASMERDNLEAMMQLKNAGFTSVFLDDDFRMGNHGPEITGCFCDACIAEFNQVYHRHETRESIGLLIERAGNGQIINEWVDYTCAKITHLAKALALPGIELGIMVMHRGDHRHGIRVSEWKPFVRHVRVGEAHFSDRDFDPPRGKASEIAGMQLHVVQMRPAELYSETTGFPPRALSAANWVCKAKLAVALGIPNIFLMGGTWLLDHGHWQSLAKALPGLRVMADLAGGLSHPRVAPVHVAVGKNDFELPWWPLRAGIPARPALSGDAVDDGKILLVLGSCTLEPGWIERAGRYDRVFFDAPGAASNKVLFQGCPSASMLENAPLAVARFTAKARPDHRDRSLARRLRQELQGLANAFPHLDRCMDIFITWIPDRQIVLACNLRSEPNACSFKYGEHGLEFELGGLEMVAIKISGGEPAIAARA